jgi:hypothetical protein
VKAKWNYSLDDDGRPQKKAEKQEKKGENREKVGRNLFKHTLFFI